MHSMGASQVLRYILLSYIPINRMGSECWDSVPSKLSVWINLFQVLDCLYTCVARVAWPSNWTFGHGFSHSGTLQLQCDTCSTKLKLTEDQSQPVHHQTFSCPRYTMRSHTYVVYLVASNVIWPNNETNKWQLQVFCWHPQPPTNPMAKSKTTGKHAQGSNMCAKALLKPVLKTRSSHKWPASDGPTDDQTSTNSADHEVCLAHKKANLTAHVDE